MARSWEELGDTIRLNPIEVTMVDPAFSGGIDTREVLNLLEVYPSIPIVVYTVASPPAFKAVAELSKRGLQHVLLYHYDDSQKRMLETLERLPGYQLSSVILEGLSKQLALLPVALVRAVERLFQYPHMFSGAADLAVIAGMPVGRMYRRFAAAGVRQPKKLFIAARLLRAHAYMQDPGYTIEDIAKKLGYSHPRMFTRHAQRVLALRPTGVRRTMSDEEIIARVLAWVNDERDGSDDGIDQDE